MNRILLDTHAFLWFVFDHPQLSQRADALISDDTIEKYLSIASLWEIAIKQQIGKLALGMDFETFLRDFVIARKIEVLTLDPPHLIAYAHLPLHHRDPFDRLLIAQARVANLPILTADRDFASYEIAVTW
ncbi:MAG: type II toxin-antitoxin system VapC family toxin [Myxococcota bacterium]|nr:type II toxin-antitoxin system VapC family toxin [Myxococcota bacterium]